MIISKTNGKNKVIDFRDGLVLAKLPDDYAMVHGSGGKNHNPVSVIKMYICDFSAGTGNKSKTVSANLEVDKILYLYEAAKNFLLGVVPSQNSVSLSVGASFTEEEKTLLSDALKAMLTASKNGNKLSDSDFILCGKALRAAVNKATESKEPKVEKSDSGNEFSYSQERINIYKKDETGYAPVSKMLITHQSMYNGNVSKYPWYIKITNGTALVKESDIGGVNYDGKSFKVNEEAFINVSDADMFKMMSACIRFIQMFENANAEKIMNARAEMREKGNN